MNIKNFIEGDTVGLCPRCHKELKVRNGKYGLFIGCTSYPNCKKTFPYEGFRVNTELIKLQKHNDYETIKKIIDTTEDKHIKEIAEEKLLTEHYCECGEKVHPQRQYRLTPDYPIYLVEYHCPTHGYYITTKTKDYEMFNRMGRIDQGGDDSHITGGYWI